MSTLNDVTHINNFLAVRKDSGLRATLFEDCFRCGENVSHKFFFTRTELLTDQIIQKVWHFVQEHAWKGFAGQKEIIVKRRGGATSQTFAVRVDVIDRIIPLGGRTRAINNFKSWVQKVACRQQILEIPSQYETFLFNVELCLDEKIEILYMISDKCEQLRVDKPDFEEDFRKKFADGANFIVRHYFQCLYEQTHFKKNNVQHLFNVIGPFVTEIDLHHMCYCINNYISGFIQDIPDYEGIFPNANRVKIGLFRIAPDEKHNPLIFFGKIMDYRNRRRDDLGIDVRSWISPDNQRMITDYFPATTVADEVNAFNQTLNEIRERINHGRKGHKHSALGAAAYVGLEQVPFLGPVVNIAHYAPIAADHAHLYAVFAQFISETAESVLRVLEVFHISGIAETIHKMGEVFRVTFESVPVIGTALLWANFGKHAVHLFKLLDLRDEIELLRSRLKKTRNNKKRLSLVKDFLSEDYYPSEKVIKEKILKHVRGLDPRLKNDALKQFIEDFSNEKIKKLNRSREKEIYKAFINAVEKNYSADQLSKLTDDILNNVCKRIYTEYAQLTKTGVSLTLSAGGLVTAVNAPLAFVILATNVGASLGLTYYEHHLMHQKFVPEVKGRSDLNRRSNAPSRVAACRNAMSIN